LGERREFGYCKRVLGGAGTQTAGLAFGGFATPFSNATEEYNGSAWTGWRKFRNSKIL
jgi:hypothetical protein